MFFACRNGPVRIPGCVPPFLGALRKGGILINGVSSFFLLLFVRRRRGLPIEVKFFFPIF